MSFRLGRRIADTMQTIRKFRVHPFFDKTAQFFHNSLRKTLKRLSCSNLRLHKFSCLLLCFDSRLEVLLNFGRRPCRELKDENVKLKIKQTSCVSGWHFGDVLCKATPYLQGVTVCASVNTLAAIAIER